MTGVLVCDDAKDMRDMLRETLDEDDELEVVGEAADGVAVVRLAAALRPDVVLLDLGMPGPGPREVIAGVRAAAPAAAIVVLSGYGPERLGADAGSVSAHVPKTAELDDVRRAVLLAGAAA
jgi:DNA-binding NarL/FixJ family response regulator